jgi:hypothetical protein
VDPDAKPGSVITNLTATTIWRSIVDLKAKDAVNDGRICDEADYRMSSLEGEQFMLQTLEIIRRKDEALLDTGGFGDEQDTVLTDNLKPADPDLTVAPTNQREEDADEHCTARASVVDTGSYGFQDAAIVYKLTQC